MTTKKNLETKLPKPAHLEWLVESRTLNQRTCAKLYRLIKSNRQGWPKGALGYDAKTLISIGFSLWRAAFLADKSGKLKETNDHATYFLEEMLETNAIAFIQDKRAKGFTFNYYIANARFRLSEYHKDHSDFDVEECLLKKGKLAKITPKERWRAFQKGFEAAVEHFENRLTT